MRLRGTGSITCVAASHKNFFPQCAGVNERDSHPACQREGSEAEELTNQMIVMLDQRAVFLHELDS